MLPLSLLSCYELLCAAMMGFKYELVAGVFWTGWQQALHPYFAAHSSCSDE